MRRFARSSTALVAGVLALAPGCSLVAGHDNAGIPFLEEANSAVGERLAAH